MSNKRGSVEKSKKEKGGVKSKARVDLDINAFMISEEEKALGEITREFPCFEWLKDTYPNKSEIMDKDTFNSLVESRIQKIKSLCESKGQQYAQADRLHNFKSAARQLGCSPERALLGMVIKQWTWILDRIKELDEDRDLFSLAEWDERYGDVIVYMCLLEGLIHGRKGEFTQAGSW